MIVEPIAGDRVEDNLNPVGRAYYAFSTLLCTPASLSQEVGLALGAQAGEARIREVVTAGGLQPLPPRRRDAVQPRLRGPALSRAAPVLPSARAARRVRARTRGRRARLYWEIHGGGSPTIVLLPPRPISHSRIWKAQVHYLSRHFRVVVYDGRGNGNSGVPDTTQRGRRSWVAADCLAVMDAADAETAILAAASAATACGRPSDRRGAPAARAGHLCARHGRPPADAAASVESRRARDVRAGAQRSAGWEWENRHSMLRDYAGFLEFFFGEMFPEPHSTKQIEDAVAFGLADRSR